MPRLTATSLYVNAMPEPLSSRAILDAASELDRQCLADAVIAFDLAEIAARHEQDEIHYRVPRTLDQLPDAERSAFIANAKLSLRMNRPEWLAVQRARMHTAAVDALKDYASQWIPSDHIDALGHYLVAAMTTAGRYVMDEQTANPTPREFAAALQSVRR